MPNYDYHCENCQHTLEAFQKITESPLTHCPKCDKNTLKRGPGGGIGLSFKGSGFYINDYASPKKDTSEPSSNGGCCPCGKNKESCSSSESSN